MAKVWSRFRSDSNNFGIDSNPTPTISESTPESRSAHHCPESFGIVRNRPESSRIVRNHSETPGVVLSRPESLRVGVIPSRSESFGIGRSCLELAGVVERRSHPESFGVFRSRRSCLESESESSESKSSRVGRSWPAKQRPVYAVHAQSEKKHNEMKWLIIHILHRAAPVDSDGDYG